MKVLALAGLVAVASVSAEEKQLPKNRAYWHEKQFGSYYNAAGGYRRLGRTKNQIKWQRVAEAQGRVILCKMRTGGWCTNLAPHNMVCDKQHSGTYPPNARADAWLKRQGQETMCGTHKYYVCDWGQYKAKECDDATQRYWKPSEKLFPEFLGFWHHSQKRKAKWWGSCKAGTGSSAPYEGGWNGEYNLVYDDAACIWTKVKIPDATDAPVTSPLSDDDYYEMYMAFNADNADDSFNPAASGSA